MNIYAYDPDDDDRVGFTIADRKLIDRWLLGNYHKHIDTTTREVCATTLEEEAKDAFSYLIDDLPAEDRDEATEYIWFKASDTAERFNGVSRQIRGL